MSINRRMEKYLLQKQLTKESDQSGADVVEWHDVTWINVAVYKKNEYRTVATQAYITATHTGCTCCKDIAAHDYRLKCGERVFEITDCNTAPRLTQLILKEFSHV